MKVYDAATIRNVALVGHTGSGKTQLASAILSDSGMVNRFGKVDEGTTVTDCDEEEIARKHTLSASVAYAEWSKQKINLIDTPGIGNFLSDARAALHVSEGALVVVDAVSGVMVQTEKVWEACDELALPAWWAWTGLVRAGAARGDERRRWRQRSFRLCAPRPRSTSAFSSCSTPSRHICRRRPTGRTKAPARTARKRPGRPTRRRRPRRSSGRRSPIRSPAGSRCSAWC